MIAVVSTPNPHSVRMSELISEMEKVWRGREKVPEEPWENIVIVMSGFVFAAIIIAVLALN